MRLLPHVPGLIAVLAKGMRRSKTLRDLPLAYGLLAKSGIPDEMVRSYVEPCASNPAIRRDVAKFARSAAPAVTRQVAKELRSFDRPVLLLWTPEDRFFPVSLAHRFLEDLPNASLVTIDDAYVFVAEDQPAQVAREIDRFVAGETDTHAQPMAN